MEITNELLWMICLLVIAMVIFIVSIVQTKLKKMHKLAFIAILAIILIFLALTWDVLFFPIIFIILDIFGIIYLIFKLKRQYQYILAGMLLLIPSFIFLGTWIAGNAFDFVLKIVGTNIELPPGPFLGISLFLIGIGLIYIGIKGVKNVKKEI